MEAEAVEEVKDEVKSNGGGRRTGASQQKLAHTTHLPEPKYIIEWEFTLEVDKDPAVRQGTAWEEHREGGEVTRRVRGSARIQSIVQIGSRVNRKYEEE